MNAVAVTQPEATADDLGSVEAEARATLEVLERQRRRLVIAALADPRAKAKLQENRLAQRAQEDRIEGVRLARRRREQQRLASEQRAQAERIAAYRRDAARLREERRATAQEIDRTADALGKLIPVYAKLSEDEHQSLVAAGDRDYSPGPDPRGALARALRRALQEGGCPDLLHPRFLSVTDAQFLAPLADTVPSYHQDEPAQPAPGPDLRAN
jgi:hypothetical protein